QGKLQPPPRKLNLDAAHEKLGRPGTAPVVGSGTPDVRVPDGKGAWLTLSDGDNVFHPIAVGAWGGYALHPHIISESVSGRHEWLLDPFAFFKAALRLPVQPVFDLTTENGRRFGLIEVRGDRLFAKDEHGVAAIDRLRAWIEKRTTPVTLGVIEAEVTNETQRDKVRQLAAMPQVRLASHTYSHPFYWGIFEGKTDANQQPYRYSVFMEDYAAEMARETAGTIEFMQSVAPKFSRSLIWSGNGKPGAAALAAAEKGDLSHYGGGGLSWQSGTLSLADLSPTVRPTYWGTQVLTPLVGEPLFAQLWYGEALNFGKISEWNRELDLPRRLRASSISFHADAMLNAGGVELLDQLADEQQKENVMSLWVDEYAQRARAFQTASIARALNGNWLLFGDALRTVRLPVSEMIPQISNDVVGYSDRGTDRYIYLARNHAVLKPERSGNASGVRLFDASAPLKSWHINANGSATLLFEPRGDLTLKVPASCKLSVDGASLTARRENSHTVYIIPERNASGEFNLAC
ncbi:MAG: RNA-binding protein, partial [Nitrosospira sp.]|nr:RNA-binding protein [Nitrosospira sp.]